MALLRSMEQEQNKSNARIGGHSTGKLQPKAIVSVTGTPSFAGVLTFQVLSRYAGCFYASAPRKSAGMTASHAHI